MRGVDVENRYINCAGVEVVRSACEHCTAGTIGRFAVCSSDLVVIARARRGAPLGRIVVGESGKDEIGLHRVEKEDGGDHEEAIAHRRIDTKVKASSRI